MSNCKFAVSVRNDRSGVSRILVCFEKAVAVLTEQYDKAQRPASIEQLLL